MPLRDAIKTAEQQNGGKAIGGGLEAQNGEAFYAVTLVQNGQPKNVRLNPQTGQLAAVPLNRLNNSQNNSENNPEDNSQTSPENNPGNNPGANPRNGFQNNPQGGMQNNGMPNRQ